MSLLIRSLTPWLTSGAFHYRQTPSKPRASYRLVGAINDGDKKVVMNPRPALCAGVRMTPEVHSVVNHLSRTMIAPMGKPFASGFAMKSDRGGRTK